MRAVVVNQASTGVEVVDHEKPSVVGHGQALVKVEYCGVCHTDLHVSSWRLWSSTRSYTRSRRYWYCRRSW